MHPGVKYELQELERLISLSQEKTGIDEPSEPFKDTIRQEVERIKRTFVHEVFSFEDERHLERYIQYAASPFKCPRLLY